MAESIRSGSVRWLWVLIFSLVTLALVAGAYAYYVSEAERIRQEKHQEIAAIGELKAGQIHAWRQERLRDLWRATKAPFFKRAVEELIRNPENGALQEELRHRLEIEQQEEGYADVLLLNTQGHFMLSSTLDPHPLSVSAKNAIDEAVAKRAPVLSDLYFCSHGVVHLDAVAPILDTAGKPAAVLVLRTNVEAYLYPLIRAWPTPSRTAETLLVRKDGDGLLFLNDLRHQPNSALSLREPLTLKTLPAVQAVLGRQGIFEGKDYRGVDVLADLRPIPDSPWLMVAKVDAAEILAEARYRGAVIVLFAGLFILLAAGVTAYGYRRKQVQLYRNLYRSERETRVTQGEFRTTLYSIGDGVITTDTNGLVKQMNPVAEQITGWLEAEAIGKPLNEVFQIVNEESRNEVENPVQRVLREGMVVGLANHTLLIARDGTERPIADSGAPIRDESGAITGVVLVFRDQTEERAAHEALRESEERFSKSFKNNPAWLVIVHMGTHKTLEVNDAWTRTFDYTREEAIGRSAVELGLYDQETYRRIIEEAKSKGSVGGIETTVRTRTGESRVLLVSREVMEIGGEPHLLAMGLDITDRKRTEEALRASESFLSSVIDQSPNPMWISDHQGTLIRANKALRDLLHISDEEIVGKYNVLNDNIVEEQGALPLARSVFERGDTVRFEIKYDTSELKHLELANSAFVILDVTIFPIKDSRGNITNAVIQHIDITEREKAEEDLKDSEERYRHLVEMSLDGIAVHQDGVVVFVNPAAARMIGADSPGELLGKSIQDFVRPDCWEATKNRLQRMLKGETGLSPVEDWYVKLDRTEVPVEVTASPLTYGGKPAVQIVARDITERKRAEAALRTSEAQLSNALEMAHLGHWEYDVTKDVFTFNDHFYKILRTTAEEVGGYTMSSAEYARRFVHPDDMSVVADETQKAIETDDPLFSRQLEHRMLYANGEIGHITVRFFIVKDELGRTVRTYGVNQDITERKRAEEAVRESEERYRSLFENMLEGYAYCKMLFENSEPHDFIFLDVNEAFDRLTGLKNVVGKTIKEMIPGVGESNREMLEVLGRVALTGNSEKLETYIEHLGIWLSISVYSSEREYFVAVFDNITGRKVSDKKLRQAEKRYRGLFENAPLMYVITRNEQGVPFISDCNEVFLECVGCSRDEVVGHPLADFYSPESRSALFEGGGYARALAGEFFMGERQLLTRDGRLIPTLLYTATEVEPSGKVIGTRAMFVDITERREAEAALQESEQRLELAVHGADLGLWDLQLPSGQAIANRRSAEMIGYSLDEIEQSFDFWESLLHPDDHQRALEKVSSHLQGLTDYYEDEYRVKTKSGDWRWILSRGKVVERDREGKPLRMTGTYLDVTERREAEEALQFERRQLLSIFESINEVIIVIDPQTYEILYANKFTDDLYGKSLVGGYCYEKFGGVDGPCDHCLKDKVMNLQGKPYQWAYHSEILNRDFLATDRMIRWPDGRDVKFQLALDITERKRAEQEKENLSSQLLQAQKMEAVGILAGGVAHDFNNLLQVVLGYSELILDDGQFPSQYKEDLTRMNQAARNGADLVHRLLTFSRKTEVKPRPLNLNRRIEQLQKMLSRTIPRMIEIELILASDLAALNADPTQMEQVLMNLAVNARDAMPEGGKLTIRTENVTLDEHYSRSHLDTKPGSYVMLSVADTGRGMDKETVQHIFEPFFSTKGPGEGTGLGLAMVYGIVKQHGGHIMCYSQPSQGTIFRMYFPALVSEETPLQPEYRVVPKGGSETILIVDDEELIRDLGARILTKAGYKVIAASNGKEALEMYQENGDEISLVLLDLIMPEMGGKQCLEELLNINPEAKVLIASGYSADGSTKESTEIGARGFVAKPYEVRKLLETVRNVLDS